MQLGTIHSLDAALGVLDDSDMADQTRRSRRYLPPAHRRFLHAVDDLGPLIPASVAATRDADPTHRFNACLKALATSRVAHVTRGARYLSTGRDGESSRVSTGLGTSFRPDRPATGGTQQDGDDPVDLFRRSMTERIHETRAAALAEEPCS